jgi:hypothetical protein
MSNRETVDTGSDKRYVLRDQGQFTPDQVNVGNSSAADQRQDSKTPIKKGHGDRGDRKS